MTPDVANRIYHHLDRIVETCRTIAQIAPGSREQQRLRLRDLEALATDARDTLVREHPLAKAAPPACCSFCGKAQSEVAKLIAGPSAHICNECIDLSSVIVAKERSAPHPSPEAQGPAMDPSDNEPTERAASYRRSVPRSRGKS